MGGDQTSKKATAKTTIANKKRSRSANRASGTGKKTRIQTERQDRILNAALNIFSMHGFRGSTIDQIAEEAGMSKPNLLYYFGRKEDIHKSLIEHLLVTWLDPLEKMDATGDPIEEILSYVRRKLEMAKDFPRESRLFANEVLQGAPRIIDLIEGELKELVDRKALVLEAWMKEGKLAAVDPHHMIFSIWATTQHYADFDVQVRAVLGTKKKCDNRFEDAAEFLENFYAKSLAP